MINSVAAPQKLVLHKISRTLEVVFSDGKSVVFQAAWLRAQSPSAANRVDLKPAADFVGVNILSVEPVGNYAVKLLFSDGHQSGIYSWETMAKLSEDYQQEIHG